MPAVLTHTAIMRGEPAGQRESAIAFYRKRGASPDESREFDVAYPADYDRKQLAGRTVRWVSCPEASE